MLDHLLIEIFFFILRDNIYLLFIVSVGDSVNV